MTNTTTAAPNRNISQIQASGDVGGFIQKNKTLLIVLFVVLAVAIIGIGFYGQMADETKAKYNSEIYNFEQNNLKKYSETGADSKSVVESFNQLHKTVKNYSGLFPVVIKLSDALVAHKSLEEAMAVLAVGAEVSNNEYNNYFLLSRQAVVLEDLNQDQKAIEVLEKMNSSKLKVFEGKIYLDLGRLYLKTGNKEKAKASFQYVVEKAHDEAEFVKIAKLYLAKI
jgi:predicted negative regulator of RcsB-dependent stress response